MIYRNIQSYILELAEIFPVVGILGPRQVGKTTLTEELAGNFDDPVFLDMEKAADLAKLEEPELYLSQHSQRLVVIDEIQQRPGLFSELRAIIDAARRPGRFLITGSASPDLLRQSSESLAGRIGYAELTPFSATEVDDPERLWFRGGFPLSYTAKSDRASSLWRKMFISTFLERDLNRLGFSLPPHQIGQLWEMLAHFQGQTLNASKLAANFGVSVPTIKRYLAVLEGALMVRQLYPYTANIKKRLVKTPKVYIRDSGLLHELLRINSPDALFGHPNVGASYEGWVIEQIINVLKPLDYRFYFYRTHAGAEVDLLVDTGTKLIPVEIKRSLSPRLSRGFSEALKDLSCTSGYLIYPGIERYQKSDNCCCTPLLSFLDEHKKSGRQL